MGIYNPNLDLSIWQRTVFSLRPSTYAATLLFALLAFFIVLKMILPLIMYAEKGEKYHRARSAALRVPWFLIILHMVLWFVGVTIMYAFVYRWDSPGGFGYLWSLCMSETTGLLTGVLTALAVNTVLLDLKMLLSMTSIRENERDAFIRVKDYLIIGATLLCTAVFVSHVANFYMAYPGWTGTHPPFGISVGAVIVLVNFDPVGEICGVFNRVIGNFGKIVMEIKEYARDLSESARDLTEKMKVTSGYIEEISGHIKHTKDEITGQQASVEQSTSSVEQVARNIQSLDNLIAGQAASVSESSAAIEEMVASINSVTATVEKLTGQFELLQNSAGTGREKIDFVVKQIHEVQDGAGEMTQGIQVIQDEMEKLMTRSRNITRNIEEIFQKTGEINGSVKSVKEMGEKNKSTIDGLTTVSEQFTVKS